jgi:HSP20 family molecular chaperone IbpA
LNTPLHKFNLTAIKQIKIKSGPALHRLRLPWGFMSFWQKLKLVYVLLYRKEKEISAMKKNKNNNQSLDLITTVDVLNTLSGGVSEPQQNFLETELGRELRIRVPGVHKGSMNVEIHNNHLTIYYYINIASYDKLVQVPQIIYNRAVPYYIDISKIHATFEVDELVVHMPFNKLSNGYHRKVRINEN